MRCQQGVRSRRGRAQGVRAGPREACISEGQRRQTLTVGAKWENRADWALALGSGQWTHTSGLSFIKNSMAVPQTCRLQCQTDSTECQLVDASGPLAEEAATSCAQVNGLWALG